MNTRNICAPWLVGLSALFFGTSIAIAQGSPPTKSPPPVLIVVDDRSGSRAEFEDHDLAVILHQLSLAKLGEDLAVVAIFYSDAVRVVGVNGGPTLAVDSIRSHLLKSFPAANGPTPMVEAFEKVLAIVKALPAGTDVTVLHMSDGEPESGRLQPDEYPEVKAAVAKIMDGVQAKYRDFPPAVVQKKLSEAFQDLGDPTKDASKPIWELQRKGEFGKTKKLLEAFKAARVRLVTVDYVGLAPLKALHDAGSNRPADYLLATPSRQIFPLLHQSKLVRLPRVVAIAPEHSVPDGTAYEKTLSVKGDALCDRMLVTLVFDSSIPDFDANASLDVRIGTRVIKLTTANEDPSAVLSREGSGKVDAAHLQLDEVPVDGIRITYRSAKGTVSWPGATVYSHLRLGDGSKLDFRPRHVKPEVSPPYGLAVKYGAEWSLAVFAKGQSIAYPLQAAEVVFRNASTGAETLLSCVADPDVKGTFLSEKKELPAGWYDAEVHLTLASGARPTLLLPKHVQVCDNPVPLTLDFPLPPLENGSLSRSHPHLGELGDKHPNAKIELTLRSPLDYPIELRIEPGDFSDSQGYTLTNPGVTVRPNIVTLHPGRPQKITLFVALPDSLEPNVVDGPIRGRIVLIRTDRNEAVAMERFNPPSGYDPAVSVDTIGFDLKRPLLTVGTYRILIGDETQSTSTATKLVVRNDVAQPFERTIPFVVRHDSQVERIVTVRPLGPFRDRDGREVPSARFVRGPKTDAVPISPGESETFPWLLQVDEDPRLDFAETEVEISAPGVRPRVVKVELRARRPLLGTAIRSGLELVALLATAAAGTAFIRRRRARRFTPGRLVLVTPDRPLTGIVRLVKSPRGDITALTDAALLVGSVHDAKLRPILADREIPLVPQGRTSLVLAERAEGGGDGWRVLVSEFHEQPATLTLEVLDAPSQVRVQERARRQFRRRTVLAVMAGTAAVFFFTPRVITAAQWVCDLIPI